VSASEGYATIGTGIRLYFRKMGGGPQTIVIPNGFHLIEDLGHLGQHRTLIVYDVRNRGRSDTVSDRKELERGILNDVDDLEALREHLGIERLIPIGHSYLGLTVILYAAKYPGRVERLVQIGPVQPDAAKKYGPDLSNNDGVLAEVLGRMREIMGQPEADPVAHCHKLWSVLRRLYVTSEGDAHRIRWDRCELENERSFMKYWTEHLLPSIQRVSISQDERARVRMPVLTVHGTKDRSAPYGGGVDWARMLPNARLLTVESAAHAPWIEAPELVLGGIDRFLGGQWPEASRKLSE
jgi:proline iminopeptidase